MVWPADAETIVDLVDGTDYMEADNINEPKDKLARLCTSYGTPGAAQSHNATLLALLAGLYIGGRCYKKDDDEIYVGAFYGTISNAAGSIRKFRVITDVTTLSASDLDTGSFADDTFYYIYATADDASTEPTFVISASSTTPGGGSPYTYYRKIGWFYNESAGALDITSGYIGNFLDGSGNPNSISVEGTDDIVISSAAYADMTGMTIPIVTSGRPVDILFSAPFYQAASGGYPLLQIDIDGSPVRNTLHQIGTNTASHNVMFHYSGMILSAGEHVIKMQWKGGSSNAAQRGSTDGSRILTVTEK